MINKSIVICGGDRRQKYMYEIMCKKGLDVSTFALFYDDIKDTEEIRRFDVVIFPVPVTKDGIYLNCERKVLLSDVLGVLCDGQVVMGGVCRELDMIDYYMDEDFQTQNALPTAEGALQVAMENTDFTINGSECAVLGYGRIGKLLADLLKNIGANVTVCARNPKDLSLAKAFGFKTVHINRISDMGMYDIVFNTVPALIVPEAVIKTTKKDVLMVELASKPYGIDLKSAEELGRKVIVASGLPGRVAPKTSGKILCDVILDILGGMENGT